jgi:hypothetical protein
VSGPGAPALSPLEVASGLVLDPRRSRARLPSVRQGTTPRAALEAAVLPALRRSPCLVSFSGGRDSSAVLAVAASVARREGLPLPIPATNRFPGARLTDEAAAGARGRAGLRGARRAGGAAPPQAAVAVQRALPRADPRGRGRRLGSDRNRRRRGVLPLPLVARAGRRGRPRAPGSARRARGRVRVQPPAGAPAGHAAAPGPPVAVAAAGRDPAGEPRARRRGGRRAAALAWRLRVARGIALAGDRRGEPPAAGGRRRRRDRPSAARPLLPRRPRRTSARGALRAPAGRDADAGRRPPSGAAGAPAHEGQLRRGVLARRRARVRRLLGGRRRRSRARGRRGTAGDVALRSPGRADVHAAASRLARVSRRRARAAGRRRRRSSSMPPGGAAPRRAARRGRQAPRAARAGAGRRAPRAAG